MYLSVAAPPSGAIVSYTIAARKPLLQGDLGNA